MGIVTGKVNAKTVKLADGKNYKQSPKTGSTLTKEIYFRPFGNNASLNT